MNLTTAIKPEYLSSEQREIANIVGIEAYIKLMNAYGGEKIYISKLSSIINKHRNEIIRDCYDGSNHRELHLQFGVSIRELDKILQGIY